MRRGFVAKGGYGKASREPRRVEDGGKVAKRDMAVMEGVWRWRTVRVGDEVEGKRSC